MCLCDRMNPRLTLPSTYCFDNNDPNSKAQLWDVPAKGATGPVRVINTNLCLDAGNNPGNGSGLKVWTCYDGLLQQTWKRGAGNSNTFALSNGQCLDVERGSTGQSLLPYSALENVQTWQCSNNGDVQQVFYTLS
ncbi:hypothetical protein JCM24511_02200 [Saitozyma sp. JCM 24511]|nr:hypothetical protein JCM24511_02200 [Saitozyma sp. JCM 24511]